MKIRWGRLFAVVMVAGIVGIYYQAKRTGYLDAITNGPNYGERRLDPSVVTVVYVALFLLFILGVIRLWLNNRNKPRGPSEKGGGFYANENHDDAQKR